MTIDSILTTSDSAYSKADLNSETLEKTEEDIAGPFDLGVSITETLKDDKQTQIIYYSTANLMDSQINAAVAGGNEQLIMESLNWMCSSDEAETVSIPSKSLQVTALTPTAYDVSFWKILYNGPDSRSIPCNWILCMAEKEKSIMKSKTVKLISGVAVLAVLSGTYIGVTSYVDSQEEKMKLRQQIPVSAS